MDELSKLDEERDEILMGPESIGDIRDQLENINNIIIEGIPLDKTFTKIIINLRLKFLKYF